MLHIQLGHTSDTLLNYTAALLQLTAAEPSPLRSSCGHGTLTLAPNTHKLALTAHQHCSELLSQTVCGSHSTVCGSHSADMLHSCALFMLYPQAVVSWVDHESKHTIYIYKSNKSVRASPGGLGSSVWARYQRLQACRPGMRAHMRHVRCCQHRAVRGCYCCCPMSCCCCCGGGPD